MSENCFCFPYKTAPEIVKSSPSPLQHNQDFSLHVTEGFTNLFQETKTILSLLQHPPKLTGTFLIKLHKQVIK